MLTPKEEAFLVYWEANRLRQKRGIYQLLVGLPMGLLFGGVILFNFYSGWYKRADMVANSKINPIVLLLAIAGIAIFFAVFSKKFQWDQYEQRYQELQIKKQRNLTAEAAHDAPIQSTEKQE